MIILLVFTFNYLLTSYCYTQQDDKDQNICGIGRQWLESILVSTECNGNGFHREMVTTVKFSPDVPNVLNVLLVHKLPRGIYVDPYQLATLNDSDSHLQILLDSPINLEAPAHRTGGFSALLYATLVGQRSKLLKKSIPIHCRYHEPSFGDQKAVIVNIGSPDLLLRSATCIDGSNFKSYSIVDAPCTATNSSICSWVQIHLNKEQSHVSLQIPVGDGSLVIHVICGTLLVTFICCSALSLKIWKHRVLT
ncbi:unnamed protein product [Boreogadus saida]